MKHVDRLKPVYERWQTADEAESAGWCGREFSMFRMFIDDKPWNGDIVKVLENNYQADSINVPAEERELIRQKLKAVFNRFY